MLLKIVFMRCSALETRWFQRNFSANGCGRQALVVVARGKIHGARGDQRPADACRYLYQPETGLDDRARDANRRRLLTSPINPRNLTLASAAFGFGWIT